MTAWLKLITESSCVILPVFVVNASLVEGIKPSLLANITSINHSQVAA